MLATERRDLQRFLERGQHHRRRRAAERRTSTANVVQNAGFESGTSDWRFYTNATGSFTVAGPGDGSANAAVVTTTTVGSNIQLYQPDVPLQPNTAYRLTFSAFSNTGRDLRVTVQKHGSPYTNYGLYREVADLATGWQSFTFDFTTTGFSTPVTDARLMFWFASDAAPGDVFRIDNVSLTTAGASTPVAPSITTGPANQSVVSGQTATFAVAADGTAPLTYQWQKNGVDIVGATGASYTTPATTLADNGALFRCRVTNGAGSVTSGSATVQVPAAGALRPVRGQHPLRFRAAHGHLLRSLLGCRHGLQLGLRRRRDQCGPRRGAHLCRSRSLHR